MVTLTAIGFAGGRAWRTSCDLYEWGPMTGNIWHRTSPKHGWTCIASGLKKKEDAIAAIEDHLTDTAIEILTGVS